MRKHARNDVVIDEHAALTTGTGQPVSFPDLPGGMLPAEFRVILASYLVSEYGKHQNSPYNFDAAELETENVILEVTQ